MRISDWSSDVCSSDLYVRLQLSLSIAFSPFCLFLNKRRLIVSERVCERWRISKSSTGGKIISHSELEYDIDLTGEGFLSRSHNDRKRVVEGKSVDERVDSGGRCCIKKKILIVQ